MDTLLAAMFGAGLAAGVHCVAMCGGIVTAFDAGPRPVIRIRPAQAGGSALRRLAFNAGRITTYGAAGAAVSLLGAGAVAAGLLPSQQALGVASAVMLILVGLYLLGLGRVLEPFERLGAPLWRRLMPLASRLLPARSWAQAYAAGLLWGFLPCAMVYAALGAAAFAGAPARGALAMAAFGLGTLPFLLAAGWLSARIRRWRRLAAAIVLGSGAYGLAQAGTLGETIRQNIFCF